jgi:hypothetical protein
MLSVLFTAPFVKWLGEASWNKFFFAKRIIFLSFDLYKSFCIALWPLDFGCFSLQEYVN